ECVGKNARPVTDKNVCPTPKSKSRNRDRQECLSHRSHRDGQISGKLGAALAGREFTETTRVRRGSLLLLTAGIVFGCVALLAPLLAAAGPTTAPVTRPSTQPASLAPGESLAILPGDFKL